MLDLTTRLSWTRTAHDCNQGWTDACGDGCDAVAPSETGSWSCWACNSCGDCNLGSTDACGSGCDATAPDEWSCP